MQDRYPRHVVAVTGIVTDGLGRILLVKGHWRGWEPPGGQVEHGEDLVAALKREIREESSVKVEVGRLVGIYSNLGRVEEGIPEQVVLTFSCEWVNGEACAGEECSEAGWFAAEEALELVKAPQQKAKLRDALTDDGGVRYLAYRIQPYEVLLEERY